MKFAPDETRFEFRVFAPDLSSTRDALAALTQGTPLAESRETYIVTRLNIESNVKVRGGRLQVKTLHARRGLLEQWARPLDAEFPVSVDDIENIVLPALGLDLEIGERGALVEGALLALLADQHALATIDVVKQRTLYDVADCVAEFTHLSMGDDAIQTVAIEAADPLAAEALLQKIGIVDAQNDSYAEFLQRRLFRT